MADAVKSPPIVVEPPAPRRAVVESLTIAIPAEMPTPVPFKPAPPATAFVVAVWSDTADSDNAFAPAIEPPSSTSARVVDGTTFNPIEMPTPSFEPVPPAPSGSAAAVTS